MHSTDFAYICTLVREHSAIVLELGKEYLAEARLTPLSSTSSSRVSSGRLETTSSGSLS